MENKNKTGIFQQIEDANVQKYNSLSIQKMEDLLKEIDAFRAGWKSSRKVGNLEFTNSEVVKGKRKKLIINTKRD